MTITNPPSAGNGSVFTFCFPGGCLDAGNPSAGDTTAPQLSLPADMVLTALQVSGATASFTATATDDTSPLNPEVSCVPVSGSTFPIGQTTVNCSAVDDAGNVASGSFTVTVLTVPITGANLLSNPYFDPSNISASWKSNVRTSSIMTMSGCTDYLSASCSMTIQGVGSSRSVSQSISVKGKTGDKFTFGLWSKALSIPAKGQYTVDVALYDSQNRLILKKTVNFNSGAHDYQLASGSFSATKAYSKVTFTFTLNKASGTAWFDDAFLIRLP